MKMINFLWCVLGGWWIATAYALADEEVRRPAALKPGDTVAIVSSGFRVGQFSDIKLAIDRVKSLGLKPILGASVWQQDGYFAGTDSARANDINAMFGNTAVKAIFELRGGWGSERILPYLDFALIKKNPKIIMGFSDITSLLLAINKKTALITFHGPMPAASYEWADFTVNHLKDMLFSPNKVVLKNPPDYPTQVLYAGKARGRILGGNLSVLVSLIGSPYMPNLKNKILFFEEVGEDTYKIDRMLTQLKEAGLLQQLKGIVVGTCNHCKTTTTAGSVSIDQLLNHYIKPLKIPAYAGAMIGHQESIFTVPEGVLVELDADQGTITLLESAVNPLKDT